jgi:sec-independent protein translocase protein TatB
VGIVNSNRPIVAQAGRRSTQAQIWIVCGTMFDLSSSKLLILGIVALIVVGPKELPFLLKTIGKYVGMIRRQAAEFRTQFDDAMRDSELSDIKKDVEKMGQDMETTMREAEINVEKEVATANAELEASLANAPQPTFGQLDDLPPGLTNSQPVEAPALEPTAAPVKVGA